VLFCESPTYLGAIAAFRTGLPRFVEVPSDADGMVVSELGRALAATDRAKFIYVIPDFQNPSGRTWSVERRRQLLELASRARLPIVEDSPYSELRFEGPALPSIKAMDRDGLVIHLGTFSKILSPGLRIAWMTAPGPIFEKYVLMKQATDLNTATFAQQLVAAYLELGDLDGHIEQVRVECQRRRDAMIGALERELPGATFTRPRGGLFLWVELPPWMSARDLLPLALERGVAFPPGGSFVPNGGHENTLRLAYSDSAEQRIEEGVRRLGLAYRELVSRVEFQAYAMSRA
jgi:2-aminoadipate transaminase